MDIEYDNNTEFNYRNRYKTNDILLKEIKNLQLQIINLENKIDNSNNILINHIGFINGVFETIKRPLYYIMNKVNIYLHIDNQNELNTLNNV